MASPYFSAQSGNRVWLEPENMQRTGAYKVRGAYYKISALSEEELGRGLITAGAGNHARGAAYAAERGGASCVVVMPTTTPLIKVERTKAYGAEVILYGDVYGERARVPARSPMSAATRSSTRSTTPSLPADRVRSPWRSSRSCRSSTRSWCPWAGAAWPCGVSTFAKLYNPKIRVVGVEPRGAACLMASLEAGRVVKLPSASTIADGTAVLEPGERVFPYLQESLDDVITVPDEELIVAFLGMVENHKMIVENSGLLSVAALRHLPAENKRVVSILPGGNMDVITMSSVVQHGLIQRGRIFTVSVLLPDRPGMLVRVASVVAEKNGNVIRLEHNQLVSANRTAAVELRVTIEAYGEEHGAQIVGALEGAGFSPTLVQASL